MSRAIAVHIVKITAATLSGKDVGNAVAALDAASLFYLKGFLNIISNIDGTPSSETDGSSISSIDYHRLGVETAFTFVFWLLVFALWWISANLNRG